MIRSHEGCVAPATFRTEGPRVHLPGRRRVAGLLTRVVNPFVSGGLPREVRSLLLVVLVGLTSLALATVSLWLVPPYLAALVALLRSPAPPTLSRRQKKSSRPRALALQERSETLAPPEELPTVILASNEPTPRAEPAPAARSKRTRSTRKARVRAGLDPVETSIRPVEERVVRWVRVGPATFIRVEEPLASPTANQELTSATETPAELEIASESPDEPWPVTDEAIEVPRAPVSIDEVDLPAGAMVDLDPTSYPAPQQSNTVPAEPCAPASSARYSRHAPVIRLHRLTRHATRTRSRASRRKRRFSPVLGGIRGAPSHRATSPRRRTRRNRSRSPPENGCRWGATPMGRESSAVLFR